MIEFRLEASTDRAANDVKDAISRIRADLPRTVDEPIVRRIEVEGAANLSYAVFAPNQSVDRTGGIDREIRVAIDPDQLNGLGITAGDANPQLRATRTDLAGGRGEIAGREQAHLDGLPARPMWRALPI